MVISKYLFLLILIIPLVSASQVSITKASYGNSTQNVNLDIINQIFFVTPAEVAEGNGGGTTPTPEIAIAKIVRINVFIGEEFIEGVPQTIIGAESINKTVVFRNTDEKVLIIGIDTDGNQVLVDEVTHSFNPQANFTLTGEEVNGTSRILTFHIGRNVPLRDYSLTIGIINTDIIGIAEFEVKDSIKILRKRLALILASIFILGGGIAGTFVTIFIAGRERKNEQI